MQKVLVKFNRNWSDEFNVHGFAIMTAEELDTLIIGLESCTFYFGTNEGWEDEDLTTSITFRTITQEEEDTLRLLFQLDPVDHSYGIFPGLSWIIPNEDI